MRSVQPRSTIELLLAGGDCWPLLKHPLLSCRAEARAGSIDTIAIEISFRYYKCEGRHSGNGHLAIRQGSGIKAFLANVEMKNPFRSRFSEGQLVYLLICD